MKEEKTKLVLNKRIVAHLNNLEMRHVRGGDGGDIIPTRKGCGDEDKNAPSPITEQINKLLISLLVKLC